MVITHEKSEIKAEARKRKVNICPVNSQSENFIRSQLLKPKLKSV